MILKLSKIKRIGTKYKIKNVEKGKNGTSTHQNGTHEVLK